VLDLVLHNFSISKPTKLLDFSQTFTTRALSHTWTVTLNPKRASGSNVAYYSAHPRTSCSTRVNPLSLRSAHCHPRLGACVTVSVYHFYANILTLPSKCHCCLQVDLDHKFQLAPTLSPPHCSTNCNKNSKLAPAVSNLSSRLPLVLHSPNCTELLKGWFETLRLCRHLRTSLLRTFEFGLSICGNPDRTQVPLLCPVGSNQQQRLLNQAW
jgi:hypothetical protein